MHRSSPLRRVGKVVLGLVIVGWSIGPIYWAIVVSLSKPADVQTLHPHWIPHPVTWEFYRQLFGSGSVVGQQFRDAIRNSAIEATGTTAVTVLIATLAAYSFVRWKVRASFAMFVVIIATMSIPLYAVLIPLFEVATSSGQIDTYQAVVLILAASNLPLAVWLLRSHIATLPREIEEAARIDGASTRVLLMRIVVPLIAPALTAASVITFISSWAAFLIPLTFAPTSKTAPVTVLVTQFVTRYSDNYGLQAATGVVALLPPALVVAWLNRYLVAGLLRGASK